MAYFGRRKRRNMKKMFFIYNNVIGKDNKTNIEKKLHTKSQELLSPYAPNAFSPEYVEKVVRQKIDFEMSDELWRLIDAAFDYYWNDVVGYGNEIYFREACETIDVYLKSLKVVFPFERICTIVEIILDWAEQVPGVFLDESAVVIPQNHIENHPLENSDVQTNVVFISDLLKVKFKDTYNRLTKLFDEMNIEWREIPETKDIWVRDFMPIQLDVHKFLLYKYSPDYLDNEKDRCTQTDSRKVCDLLNIRCIETDFVLDGGNVTPCGNTYVLTNKCIRDGVLGLKDLEKIQSLLDCSPIIIPWHCINPDDPDADVYGHSDGFIHWCGGNRVLMSNHRDSDSEEASVIKEILEKKGFCVTEMLFDEVEQKSPEWNWAYVNYLQVGKKIIMPSFGIAEDKYALKYVREANPDCEVRQIRLRDIASNGGGLHCITWNIQVQPMPFTVDVDSESLPF